MKLCVALDLDSRQKSLELVRELKEYPIWLKVGLRSFIRDGSGFLDELRATNPQFKIFLDLKLHDIPNTMADAAEAIADLGVDMLNIHASAGRRAMNEVVHRLKDHKNRPLILAVTALTSFSDDEFRSIYDTSIITKASEFARDAYSCGVDGVVCSAYESIEIKNATHRDFITLSPGIRPFNERSEDQRRVADVAYAKSAQVDFIVVGRPIYNNPDPKGVVEKILEQF